MAVEARLTIADPDAEGGKRQLSKDDLPDPQEVTDLLTRLTSVLGAVDGLETLGTALNGFVDGLEATATSHSALLTAIRDFVDTLETKLSPPVLVESDTLASATKQDDAIAKLEAVRALLADATLEFDSTALQGVLTGGTARIGGTVTTKPGVSPILGADTAGKLLLFDDPNFDTGYRGWMENFATGGAVNAPLSLSPYPSLGGMALRLSTGRRRNTIDAGVCSAIKRLTRVFDGGKIFAEYWWTLGGENIVESPAYVTFAFDTQFWGNTGRRFPQWRFRRYDDGGTTRVDKWQILDDDASTWVDVPGAAVDFGDNGNKPVTIYTRIGYDFDANAGDGGYDSLAYGIDGSPYEFDLASLARTGERSLAIPSFSGGLNYYVTMTNRNDRDVGKAWMNILAARGWVEGVD